VVEKKACLFLARSANGKRKETPKAFSFFEMFALVQTSLENANTEGVFHLENLHFVQEIKG